MDKRRDADRDSVTRQGNCVGEEDLAAYVAGRGFVVAQRFDGQTVVRPRSVFPEW